MRYINLLLTLTLTLLGSRGIGNEIVGGNGMRMGMDVVGMGLAFSRRHSHSQQFISIILSFMHVRLTRYS